MKRGAVASAAKPVLPRKGKLKPKPRAKDKRFSPLDYLNSLIEVAHDHRQETVRKRGHSVTKRELSSALAHTTPHSERTVSSAKLRCKSAFSQNRKKSVTLKDPLMLDLNGLVTQQDVIRFTEATARGKEQGREEESAIRSLPISSGVAARRIQRAWRRHQTLKVVRHYYEEYCGLLRQERERRKEEGQQGSNRLERTLKIKRENQNQSQRNSPNTALKVSRPLFRVLDFEECGDAVTKELVREEHEQGEESCEGESSLRELGLSSSFSGNSESSKNAGVAVGGGISRQLQVFVSMFRSSHQLAAREVQQQLSAFCRAQAQVALSSGGSCGEGSGLEESGLQSELEGVSPMVFAEMEAVMLRKYELQRGRVEDLGKEEQRHALEQLEGRFRRELRAFNLCREQYLRSVRQLREGMVKMQRDCAWVARAEGMRGSRVRKSYSAESLLMKSILEEVTARSRDVDCPQGQADEMIIECDFRRKRGEESVGLAFPTSPPSVLAQQQNSACSGRSLNCYQVDTDSKLRQALFQCSAGSDFSPALGDCLVREFQRQDSSSSSQVMLKCDSVQSLTVREASLRQQQSVHLIKQCSEEIEQRIEAALVQQLAQELFCSLRFWGGFKPFVEHPFQFKAITDWDIRSFLEKELPVHFQSEEELLRRINQKINPTTLEILRLIRDFQFEVDQYELVLPEEVFRGYRRGLEQEYAGRVRLEQERPVVFHKLDGPIAALVEEREEEKRAKRGKFVCFERDLRIMYMKAVFNCLNESLIEAKSFYTFMNGRSSIGPGELTLALKEYNWECGPERVGRVMGEARGRVLQIVARKCSLPEFRSHRDLQQFQREITTQIVQEMEESEYKWVNYMDEVMEIWQELSLCLVETLLEEAVRQLVLL